MEDNQKRMLKRHPLTVAITISKKGEICIFSSGIKACTFLVACFKACKILKICF